MHGTTGEALQPLEAKPSLMAERELVRIVHSDCCVEVEANSYSAPQALIRQRVSVLVRDQPVLIRHGGRIVAEHRRREAERSLRDGNASRDQEQERRVVRSSELARPPAVYAELIGEVAA